MREPTELNFSRIRSSMTTSKLDDALAAAQREFENIERRHEATVDGETKEGKRYKYTFLFADIADLLSVVRPILAKNKITVIQATVIQGSALILVTRLASQGEWYETDYPVGPIGGKATAMGAAITYARRYALAPMIGVAAERDTDGEDAADQGTADDYKPKAPWVTAAMSAITMCRTVEDFQTWKKNNAATIREHSKTNPEEYNEVVTYYNTHYGNAREKAGLPPAGAAPTPQPQPVAQEPGPPPPPPPQVAQPNVPDDPFGPANEIPF